MTKPSTDDRVEIYDLLATYAWAIDTADVDTLVSLFTEDGWAQTGPAGRRSIRDFAIFYATERKEFRGRQHIVSCPVIRGNNDQATVRSYMTSVQWKKADDSKAIISLGYWEDVVVKRDGKWLFQQRVIKSWNDAAVPGWDDNVAKAERSKHAS